MYKVEVDKSMSLAAGVSGSLIIMAVAAGVAFAWLRRKGTI